MEVVGELLLSAAFEALFHKLASSDFLKFARQERIHSQLNIWNTQLVDIREVLDDAEDKQITSSSVKLWLSDLRNLAYDMEDILDHFNTEMLRRRRLSAPQPPQAAAAASTSRKVWSLIPTCCKTSFTNPTSHVTFNVSMGSKIKDITDRLNDISTRKAQLGLEKIAGKTNSTWTRTPTTCLFEEPQTHGRDDDKNKIVDLLLSDEPLAVIPIIGMGGLGKTTLARLVYNDDAVVKNFTPRSWVCVSDEFDVVKLTKAILSAISPSPQSSSNVDAKDFNQLQVQLSQSLSGKRFLLVLDDVWNRNYEYWNSLRSPFRGGAKGSKVIVTTRDKAVASMMEPSETYHHSLKPLTYDDCWSVFVQHAFEGRNIEECQNLKSIGKKIVEKCDGLPLAAKVLGGLLRPKLREDEWEDVLNSKIWSLSETECGIIPALRLSYHHLPPQLRRCFVYCAIFPHDYEFKETELVLLWMAEGLIEVQTSEGNKQMEDLGAEYFRELVSRSFFMQSENGDSQFVMHDLISDLAKSVGGQLFLHLEDKLELSKNHINLQETRHVSYNRCFYDIFKNFEALAEAEKLRTFIALPVNVMYGWSYLTSKVSCYLLPKLRYLRVLSMSGYCMKELPNSIGELKHLRYLNLSGTSIEWLPESIGELYNLQALILCGCDSLTTLPMSIGNLVHLRHLDISDTRKLEKMPPRIGDLANLQTLSKFIVEKDDSSSGLKELKKLSNIRGALSILGLHCAVDAQDATDLNLKEKGKIEELTMEWASDIDDPQAQRKEEQVLESLQPHRSLKKLTISCYGGGTFPSWINGNPSSFSQMVQLYLKDCRNCIVLPSLGQLSSLKILIIEGMSGIKHIGAEFYGQCHVGSFHSLECLGFSNMPKWEDWYYPSSADEELSLFPGLCVLKMWRCPELVGSLPRALSFLIMLELVECPKLSTPLPKCSSRLELNLEACNGVLLESTGVNLTSLVTLKMQKISNLSDVGEGFVEGLTALEDLSIEDCKEVRWLRLEKLGGLKRLKVFGCDGFVSLEEQPLPCNLEYLEIKGCKNLEKLPNELHSLRSLSEIRIKECPKLINIQEEGWPPMLRKLVVHYCEGMKALPKGELPTSLTQLSIEDCRNLESLPEDIMRRCNVEELNIQRCSFLPSFSRGVFPSTLKALSILWCENLMLLPLDHMHNLTSLSIIKCDLLRFQQHHMLQSLTSLRVLSIMDCPGLAYFPERGLRFALNLTHVEIEDCKNLETPLSQWGLDYHTSLKHLTISPGGYENVVSFSDDCHLPLPTSITNLRIGRFQNLESISSLPLQTLISLQSLFIHDCPKLQQFLPKEEGLPPTLGELIIKRCPIVEKRCVKDRGQDWPHISHIPRIDIGRGHV